MINEPIHATDDTFEQTVLKSELPVIVDFWAPWCGPCKMLSPLLDQAAKKYAGKLIVAKINIDDDSETASNFGVQSIPTLLFMKGGEIVNRKSGSMPSSQLNDLIQEFLF